MDESAYNLKVSAIFKKMLAALDEIDPDLLDAESTGDMLTITGKTGEKCVVNTQRSVRQMWVAGKGQGVHFSFDPQKGQWLDDKGKGLELFGFVADVVRALCGEPLRYP